MNINHTEPMSTVICLRDYKLPARIGVYEDERISMQMISVSLYVWLDNYAQVTNDDLDNTINYVKLREIVLLRAQERHTVLCETLASVIATDCLAIYGAAKVQVDVLKLERFDDCDVGVSIVRSRSHN